MHNFLGAICHLMKYGAWTATTNAKLRISPRRTTIWRVVQAIKALLERQPNSNMPCANKQDLAPAHFATYFGLVDSMRALLVAG
jgi:hypothetical protein